MHKRERLEKTIAGESTDRAPVAVWRHWPGDDQRPTDFAQALIDYQKAFDWDMLVVQPANTYSVLDYGITTNWQDTINGHYSVTRHIIHRSLEWTELRPLDVMRGEYGKLLTCLQQIHAGLQDSKTPILVAIHSPLSQAKLLSGRVQLLRDMRVNRDRLRTGLNILTENTLNFIDALRKIPISGILLMVEHASYDVISEEEYVTFGTPYDRKILESVPHDWWLNGVSVLGQAPMMRLIGTYPAQFFNWEVHHQRPDLSEGRALFEGAACGGVRTRDDLLYGTPMSIRDSARKALMDMNQRRLILSAGGPAPIITPRSNLKAMRQIVEETARI
ncbi:MAG: hypothetical protein D6712_01535 [Chloroflexi bacterium]|nr:MAG: hypothetical protein D6712_01535 [Chloroflexota bacterium]